MSEATSGSRAAADRPAFRCAHAGYALRLLIANGNLSPAEKRNTFCIYDPRSYNGSASCWQLGRACGVVTRDRVYTVSDFYDHPLGGVAEYRSKPHVYERQFSEPDDEWSDLFWLMEIDGPLLALALEQSAIYDRARRELSVIQRGGFSYDVASGVWFVEWTNPQAVPRIQHRFDSAPNMWRADPHRPRQLSK
jgi:hypothetical protein